MRSRSWPGSERSSPDEHSEELRRRRAGGQAGREDRDRRGRLLCDGRRCARVPGPDPRGAHPMSIPKNFADVGLAGEPGEKTVTDVDDSCAMGVDALAFLARIREELTR